MFVPFSKLVSNIEKIVSNLPFFIILKEFIEKLHLFCYIWNEFTKGHKHGCLLPQFLSWIHFRQNFHYFKLLGIYMYICVMSVLPVWIRPSVRSKTHLPKPLRDVRYLVGTVSAKEIDPWKQIPLRARRASAARENLLCSLHRQSQNDF